MTSAPGYRKIAEEVVFRDGFLGLREDRLASPEGTVIHRKVVEYREAAAAVPVRADGSVLLIRHYRHPIGRAIWEIPGGMLESGESARDAAARELVEETGYRADELTPLLRFHPEPAFTDHTISLFTAKSLHHVRTAREREISELWFAPRDELLRLVYDGRVASSWTAMALLLTVNADRPPEAERS